MWTQGQAPVEERHTESHISVSVQSLVQECPEVGLGFLNLTSGHVDCAARGSEFLWGPEVGLDFRVFGRCLVRSAGAEEGRDDGVLT